MAEFENFEQLDDPDFFKELVTQHFENAWKEVADQVGCAPMVDPERVQVACDAYRLNVEEIRVLLDSQNPDHYKRAAALLDALNRAKVIVDYQVDETTVSELEGGTAHGLSYDDCQYRLRFLNYYVENGNQLMAFDLAFRCCQAYEEADRQYTPNYLESMCHYLCEHDSENVDSLYMIFKSYWF
jgi:hypothetical protein